MEASRGLIESVKVQKQITDNRLKKLHESVKEIRANRRRQTEQQSRPD